MKPYALLNLFTLKLLTFEFRKDWQRYLNLWIENDVPHIALEFNEGTGVWEQKTSETK